MQHSLFPVAAAECEMLKDHGVHMDILLVLKSLISCDTALSDKILPSLPQTRNCFHCLVSLLSQLSFNLIKTKHKIKISLGKPLHGLMMPMHLKVSQ